MHGCKHLTKIIFFLNRLLFQREKIKRHELCYQQTLFTKSTYFVFMAYDTLALKFV